MWINKLEIARFRNIEQASLTLNKHLNIIYGSNGSGKSSLLETIHCLSSGHSFRTNKTQPIVKSGEDNTTIFCELYTNSTNHKLGIKRTINDTTQLRLDGRNINSQSQAALIVPVIGLSPESEHLLDGGSKDRLSFLDWSLFHVEPAFRACWREYKRIHKQRNALLRLDNSEKSLAPWNLAYSDIGERLSLLRLKLISELLPLIDNVLLQLLPNIPITISYRRGWPHEIPLMVALEQSLQSDIKMGFSHYGPHRGDLYLRSDGKSLTERLSRGQRKLVIIGLRLAQAVHYSNVVGDTPIIYIDDLPSELDARSRNRVLEMISASSAQYFITSTSDEELDIKMFNERSMFHVEQGRVVNVV